MKRNIFIKIVLAAFCLLASGMMTQSIVKADIIWEPDDDAFYTSNASSCRYVNRDYTVNSEIGYTTVYDSPYAICSEDVSEDDDEQGYGELDNGNVVRIAYTYTLSDDIMFGLIRNGGSSAGWVCMADLELVYDNISFCADYRDQFIDYDNRYKEDKVEQNIILWKYPNSGVISYEMTHSLGNLYIVYLYEDTTGNVWAYVPYYCGMSGWIFVSDPGNEDLTTLTTSEPVDTETPVSEEPSQILCTYSTVNSWPGGFIGQVDITNNSMEDIDGWNLSFDCSYEINSLWGGNLLEQKNGTVYLSNSSWDTLIKAGETKTVNFNAAGDIVKEPGNFVFESEELS